MNNIDKLKEAVQATENYQKVVDCLKEFTVRLAKEVLGESWVGAIESKFRTEEGQMFFLHMTLAAGNGYPGCDHPILRAYVPDNGFPVVIDVSSQDYSFKSLDNLEEFLYDRLSTDENFTSTLRALIALGKQGD